MTDETSHHAAFDAAATVLDGLRAPLLLAHTKPDGDAIGSLVALSLMLKAGGATPVPVVFDPVPDRYRFLCTFVNPIECAGDAIEACAANCDGLVILDTCSFAQLAPAEAVLRETAGTDKPIVVFDHHVTRDDIGTHLVIDTGAAATCQMLFDFARHRGLPLTPEIASALFAGLATDTGWFRHSNTTSDALSAAAALVDAGAVPHQLFENLFHGQSAARFRLRAAVMARTELHCDGALAVTTIPASLFEERGAVLADTEDLVNEPLGIGSVRASVLLVEQGGGVVRAGFRSKPPISPSDSDVDVSAIASRFGGGGHRRASGARIEASLEEAAERVRETMSRAIRAS